MMEDVDEKLLAGVTDDCGPVARPGDPDLSMSFTGVRIRAVVLLAEGAAVLDYDFTQAAGWWRPDAEAGPVRYDGQFPRIRVVLRQPSSGTLWCFHSWKEWKLPVELYAAPGKLTLLACPDCRVKPRTAVHEAIAPPGAQGESWTADPDLVRRADVAVRYEEGNLVQVGLIVNGSSDGGPAYARTWFVPASWEQDFAAMMTWRFGDPLEAFADVAAVQEAAGTLIARVGDGWDEDCGDDAEA